MDAVLSGRYDTSRLAVMMTQTGGCCRASNYVGFIRRALDKADLSHIPVISLNANGMERNPGFRFTLPMLLDAAHAIVYGDLFLRCLYRVRPYELIEGLNLNVKPDQRVAISRRIANKWRLIGYGIVEQ